MNKVMKKFIVLLLCLLTCLTATISFGFMGGCTPSQPQGGGDNSSVNTPGQQQKPEEEKVSISFSANEKNLIVGDEEYLFPIYDKVRGYTLTYSSDNTSVVTVDGTT